MEIGTAVRELRDVVVLGWRAWTVSETTEGLRLGSVIYDTIWVPGEPAPAVCRRDEDPFAEAVGPHRVADPSCNCGFHGARDPVDALSYLHGRDGPATLGRVLGEVALSGLVVETEAGWRAPEAYPARLYVGDAAVAEALAVYGVPVLSPACACVSATSSTAVSGGSSTSSWSAARTRSLRAGASG